jgi:hypothetical protein
MGRKQAALGDPRVQKEQIEERLKVCNHEVMSSANQFATARLECLAEQAGHGQGLNTRWLLDTVLLPLPAARPPPP